MTIWVSATEPRRVTAWTWNWPMQWFYSAGFAIGVVAPLVCLCRGEHWMASTIRCRHELFVFAAQQGL